jgi:hypothetical protein
VSTPKKIVETRFDARHERTVHPREHLLRFNLRERLTREDALSQSRAAGGPFARDVAEGKAEAAVRQVEILEEVAADGAAGDGRSHGLAEPDALAGLGQQRLLDLRRDPQFLVEARLFRRLAIQARVLDGHRGFRGQRLERRPDAVGEQLSLLTAVEIQDANRARLTGHAGRVHVVHESQRHAEHVPDAERNRPTVRLRQASVPQIGDDARLAGGEDVLGNLAAGFKARARERHLAAQARELQIELARGIGEHDESALGAGHVDGGVHDDSSTVEHARAPERATEQRGHRQSAHERRCPESCWPSACRRAGNKRSAPRLADLDPIAALSACSVMAAPASASRSASRSRES